MDHFKIQQETPTWSEQEFDRQFYQETYSGADGLGIYELTTPSRSSTFLMCHGSFDFEKKVAIQYGIEAPRHCPKRSAFEWGKMSWLDFWFHKGWIIQIAVPTNGGAVYSKLISPEELPPRTISLFKQHGHNGPYLLLRKQLQSAIAIAQYKGLDALEEEHEYLNFMSLHGHRFTDQAA